MYPMNLSKQVKITRHSNAVAAGTSDITPSAGINMAGFEGCLFLVEFGTITSSAVTSIKVQQSSDDGSSDAYGDLEGTSVTVADTDDNKIAYVDVYRPGKQYLKLIVDRDTANAVVDGITAIQYGARALPPAHDSTTVLSGSEVHASPAEGTA